MTVTMHIIRSHVRSSILSRLSLALTYRLHCDSGECAQDSRHRDEADEAGHNAGHGPGAPGDGLAQLAECQVNCQGVGCHGGNEHGTADARCLEACLHDVGSHLLLCSISRVATTCQAQCLQHPIPPLMTTQHLAVSLPPYAKNPLPFKYPRTLFNSSITT